VRICRVVASFATIETRPPCIVILTSADAVETANKETARPKSADFMVKAQYTPVPRGSEPGRYFLRK
jgi:hypothetical protein